MEVATVGILKEIRRVSDPDKAQIIWDGIKVIANSPQFIRIRPKKCLQSIMHPTLLFSWAQFWQMLVIFGEEGI